MAVRPLAVELAFDPVSDQRLARTWQRLSSLYGGPKDGELGVRPHITLALFRADQPEHPARIIDELAREIHPFGVDLAILDRFHTDEGVVFLEPRASAELVRAHARVHERLGADRAQVHVYYRPGSWRPHCTMAIDVRPPHIDAVLAACLAPDVRGPVEIARIQLVQYRPATEIAAAWLAERR